MLSVSIAFLTYEGLTRNVRVTYAKRMPGVLGASTKFVDFMASHTSGRFLYMIQKTYCKPNEQLFPMGDHAIATYVIRHIHVEGENSTKLTPKQATQ